MIDPQFQNLPPEKALEAILHYEGEANQLLANGKIEQWQAWELYFALMYECNVRALAHKEFEKEFNETRERIVSKIDQKKFNPFLSENPAIIIIARSILANHGLTTKYDN